VKGFTSISIHKEKYDILKAIAQQKGLAVTKLAEWLISQYSRPDIRAMIDEELRRAEYDWPGPYLDIVTNPDIKNYKSTAWVRTEDYIDNVGSQLWKIDRRFHDDDKFKVERVVILSSNAWLKKRVWTWIGNWLVYNFLRPENFKLFIVREKDLIQKGIDQKCYDMGIYGEPPVGIGYLDLTKASTTESYTYVPVGPDDKEAKKAEKCFDEIKRCGQAIDTDEGFRIIRKQPYNQ
jgi:hypothetical protein